MSKYNRGSIEEAVEAAAKQAREPMLHGTESWPAIPVDVEQIARVHKIEMREPLNTDDHRQGSLVTHESVHSVRVTSEPSVGLWRFTLAHEIGHTLFREGGKHKVGKIGSIEWKAEEEICNRFAAALLMPLELCKSVLARLPSSPPSGIFKHLEQSARRFQVSLPALLSRFAVSQILDEPSMILLCLESFPNAFTGVAEELRVKSCTSLGSLRSMRTWYNRSVLSINLKSPRLLYEAWKSQLLDDVEVRGGKYIINGDNLAILYYSSSPNWVKERVELSFKTEDKWSKVMKSVRAASCLYAKRGWRSSRAYIVTVMTAAE